MVESGRLRRRDFVRICAAGAAAAALPGRFAYGEAGRRSQEVERGRSAASPDPAKAALPAVGTGWHGHMFPGAVAPFGLVQLSPDTHGSPGRRRGAERDWIGWDHCSGYHYPDNVVLGFSHTHLQGTGGVDLGDILVMPLVQGKNWAWDPGLPDDQAEAQIEAIGVNSGWVFSGPVPGYRSFFAPEQEVMRPGYYSVHLLTPDVQAELTATTRCGMHRYGFPMSPEGIEPGLLVDLAHGLGEKVYEALLNIESNSRISGQRFTHGWAADKQVYFVMEFSRPQSSLSINVDGQKSSGSIGSKYSGKEIKLILGFAPNSGTLTIRVGLSCTSIEGAAKNLSAEIPQWNFDAVAAETEQVWREALGILQIEEADQALNETFYTGAYHGLVAPATFNDVDRTYRGQDQQNHPDPGFTKYTTLSIWDIFRGEFPFITLMQPQRINDIVSTLLADYQQLGLHSLPMWTLWGNETWSMSGFHAAGMIVGAYVRGFRDFDAELAYTAIRDTALIGPTQRGNREAREKFRQLGYVPAMPHGPASVSSTLDLSYDYWCAGAMAELLGKRDDAAMFYGLSKNYKNVFDPTTGFMRGKTDDGKWTEPFRPDQETDDYVETDAWQASQSVMHDVQGLIDLHGGDKQFIAKLDALFTAPSFVYDARPDISGMVGQDAQGNEPSNHIPYLYSFAGAPWKTQYWVRKVAGLYKNTRDGIPGNDDCGQLSSWFVFAALGLYPVNASTGVYVIGSPLVKRASLKNPVASTTFTIVAERNSDENVYIQSAELNSRRLSRSWLTHAEIVAGGELRFRMGDEPNREWGASASDRPPSGLLRA